MLNMLLFFALPELRHKESLQAVNINPIFEYNLISHSQTWNQLQLPWLLTKWEPQNDLVWYDNSMCIRLVIIDIMHISAEQMMQSRDPQGGTQSDQRVVPRQSLSLKINDYPVSSDHCPAVSRGGQRVCLWLCPHGLTIRERGCAVSGYCTTCVVIC